ncbi:MAG: glutamate--tRNA ligase [Clostridia bacterium]|nr:glutamate--tRNA ligase [Clostridia bacterium]
MTDKLADLLIRDDEILPLEEYERMYPPRELEKGALVTRLAPSPTGFIHLGNLYSALADERLAHSTGGIFYLRIEDTDEKRKVEGAVESVIRTLRYFGLNFDEGAEIESDLNRYGPYYQRQRASVYHAFARDLLIRDLAYPCFCTEEDLAKTREYQSENKLNTGYYGKFAICRNLSEEEIRKRVEEGKPYVIRLKSQGDAEIRHTFTDRIKGEITVPENDQDVVILKSDGIPTYHFAHAIDDHFMRTSMVIRGEEWLASLPIHIELFAALGFQMPAYGHTCSLLKNDGGTKRKLSKRKDPECSLDYYRKEGYLPTAVMKYLMTVLQSNFEEWERKNPETPYTDFKFSVGKMGKSGALFDLDKLNDVSKDEIAKLSSEDIYDFLNGWVGEFGSETDREHFKDRDYILRIIRLVTGEGSKKRRKDIVTASQGVRLFDYFFDDAFRPEYSYRFCEGTVNAVLDGFAKVYDPEDDNNTWFSKVKEVAAACGFAAENSEYKANPEKYIGNVSDCAEILRIAVAGSPNSPDLCTIMNILGRERSLKRLSDGKLK